MFKFLRVVNMIFFKKIKNYFWIILYTNNSYINKGVGCEKLYEIFVNNNGNYSGNTGIG